MSVREAHADTRLYWQPSPGSERVSIPWREIHDNRERFREWLAFDLVARAVGWSRGHASSQVLVHAYSVPPQAVQSIMATANAAFDDLEWLTETGRLIDPSASAPSLEVLLAGTEFADALPEPPEPASGNGRRTERRRA